MFDESAFDTLSFSTDAFDFGAVVPDVTPILLGRRPAINRTRENDEALLLLLGMM